MDRMNIKTLFVAMVMGDFSAGIELVAMLTQ